MDCGDYYECILKDKNSNEVARTKIDKEDYDKLKDFMHVIKQTNGMLQFQKRVLVKNILYIDF